LIAVTGGIGEGQRERTGQVGPAVEEHPVAGTTTSSKTVMLSMIGKRDEIGMLRTVRSPLR
jgi:hypothetical protein